MSNSEFVLKNPEGKSVKFNFQLENGLIFCFYKEDRTFLHGIKFE